MLLYKVGLFIVAFSFTAWVAAQHYNDSPPVIWRMLAVLLWPISVVYAGVAMVRNGLYQSGLMPVYRCIQTPVVSIGNITTGGTGKTPIIKALAEYLYQQYQMKVVLLTRGYGATAPLDYGVPTQSAHGDEAYWLQQQLPHCTVIVGRDRAANALRAEVEYAPDIILLDDGFQHRRLHRDLDVVLLDRSRGDSLQLGNRHVLPLGPLREPTVGLKRASIIGQTKGPSCAIDDIELKGNEAWHRDVPPELAVLNIPFQPSHVLVGLDNQRVDLEAFDFSQTYYLVSGIANPAQFEWQVAERLNASGGTFIGHHIFADHQHYTAESLQAIEVQATQDNAQIITTEKDWTKMAQLTQRADLWVRWCITPDICRLSQAVMEGIQVYRNQHASGLPRQTPRRLLS